MKKSIFEKITGALSSSGSWSFALTMPVFLLFFNYLMIGPGVFNDWKIFAGATLVNLAILSITSSIQQKVQVRIATRYAGLEHTFRRIFISFCSHAIFLAIFLTIIAALYIQYRLFGSTLRISTVFLELSFIESYGHLLKTRYGEGMKLYIHVEADYLSCRIPPMTLQLLVENAVKHNVIRASKPLTIFILSTQEGQLMVRNNLQKKTFTAGTENLESTRVGLANIITKYQLLNAYKPGLSEPEIESNHEFFTVTLPLIS